MESTIVLATGNATTTASASRPRERRSPAVHRLGRAIPLIKLGLVVVVQAILWVAYARRRLGWRAQGAVARWEHGITRPRGERTRGKRPAKPR